MLRSLLSTVRLCSIGMALATERRSAAVLGSLHAKPDSVTMYEDSVCLPWGRWVCVEWMMACLLRYVHCWCHMHKVKLVRRTMVHVMPGVALHVMPLHFQTPFAPNVFRVAAKTVSGLPVLLAVTGVHVLVCHVTDLLFNSRFAMCFKTD